MRLFLCTALIATAFVAAFANISAEKDAPAPNSVEKDVPMLTLSLTEKQLKQSLFGAQIDVNLNKNGTFFQVPSYISMNTGYESGIGAGGSLVVPLPLGFLFPSAPGLNFSLGFTANKNVTFGLNAGTNNNSGPLIETTTPAPSGWGPVESSPASGWAPPPPSPTPGWAPQEQPSTPGWAPPPPSPTPGWAPPPPSPTPGWAPQEQSPTPGWAPPPPSPTPGWAEPTTTTTPGWSAAGWPAAPSGLVETTTTPGWAAAGWPAAPSGWAPPPSPPTTPGWSPPPLPSSTTPGWSAPQPPSSTTPGWSAPPSTPLPSSTSGWSPPPPPSSMNPGWGWKKEE